MTCTVLSQYSTLDISKLILLVSRADYTEHFSVNCSLVASHMYFCVCCHRIANSIMPKRHSIDVRIDEHY